jgi:hypothetical protein
LVSLLSLHLDFLLIAPENGGNEFLEFSMGVSVSLEPVFEGEHDEGARPVVVVLTELFERLDFLNGLLDYTEYVEGIVLVSDTEFKLLEVVALVQKDLQVFLNNSVFMR